MPTTTRIQRLSAGLQPQIRSWTSSNAFARKFLGQDTSPTLSPDAPLDRTAIAALLEQLKALAPGHRDALARAFRTAFQVSQDTPSVAPLNLQERHRIWIEEFLAKAARG